MPLGSGRRDGGVLWSLILPIFITVIMLVLTAPAGLTLEAHRGNTPDRHGVATTGRTTSTPRAKAAGPSVTSTLDLCTNRLYTGNALPIDCGGAGPFGIAYDNNKSEILVANYNLGSLNVISDVTNKIVASFSDGSYGSYPRGVAYDSAKGEIFVAYEGVIVVFSDVNYSVITSIFGGRMPYGVTYDSGRGEVFVANSGSASVSVISDANNTIIATIPVGIQPTGIAYDPGQGEVFVTNYQSNNVSVISDTSNKVVATIDVGSSPYGLAYDSAKGEMFVSNSGSNNVSVISDTTNKVISTIPVWANPEGMAYDSANGKVFAVMGISNNVSVISDASNTVIASTSVGSGPVNAMYDSGRGLVIVANEASANLSEISGVSNSVVATIWLGTGPNGVTYDSGKGELFVANYFTNNVSVISMANNSVIASIPVGVNPWGVAYDGGKGEVFVSNRGSGNVSIISDVTDRVIGTVSVGAYTYPEGVAYDGGKGEIFVADFRTDNVSVISDVSDKTVASISTGLPSEPSGLTYDSGKGEIFVADYWLNVVHVISDSNNSVITSIPVGTYAAGVTYDQGKGEVFANSASSVSVISDTSNTVVSTINMAGEPEGMAYDSAMGEIFAPLSGSTIVEVISDSTNNAVPGVNVGAVPVSATFDALNGFIYVCNQLQGTISIINPGLTSPTYSASFSQSGLPAGTNWSVTLNGQVRSSTTSTITFNETNGTYSFSVGTVPGYSANVTSGSVTVRGGPVSRSITFTPTTTLTSVRVSPSSDTLKVGTYANFTATPSCTGGPCSGVTYSWSLNNSLGILNTTSGASVKFTATASGTENLSVTAMLNGQLAKNSSIITITTSPVPTLTYVSLTPVATTVNVTGTQTFTAAVGCSGGTCSSGSTYTWSLNNSSFGKLNSSSGPQVLFTANSTAGLVTLTVTAHLNGKTATNSSSITIKKATPPPSTYAVTFSESGLPSGTSWSVTLNAVTKSGTGSIIFTEPNGTYSFSVGAVSGYAVSPSSGSFPVSGVAVNKAITFTALPRGQYSLTFSETGLPTGTNWSVTVGSTTHTSTGSTISFTETNGTFSFTIGAVAGYTATPSSGSVTVNGAAKTASVAFAKASAGTTTYTVTFTETGLPAGTSWSVTLNGSTKSATTATITFQEPNGSYTFSVGSVSGYTVGPSPGTIKVDGAAVSQPITFTSSTSPGKGNQTTGFLGLPGYDGYLVVGIIVAAVAAGALILLLRKRSPPRGSDSVEDSKNIADGAASQVAVE